jgi:quinol monooxygenase YgiN
MTPISASNPAMTPEIRVALAHADIGPRVPNAVQNCEVLMRELAGRIAETPGVLDMLGLRKIGRGNHFELIWRFTSQEAYLEHLSAPTYHAFRAGIAPANAAPYWDRLHHVRADQRWPAAATGDFVVITQFEVQPQLLDEGVPLIDQLTEAQLDAPGLVGQVLLQRLEPSFNLELISVWSSPETFEDHVESEGTKLVRGELTPLLLAPVEDRAHYVISGEWPIR